MSLMPDTSVTHDVEMENPRADSSVVRSSPLVDVNMETPPTDSAAMRSLPSKDFQLNGQMVERHRAGMYWSITTLTAPFQPWSPLTVHPEMEIRMCHCSKSRIHRLKCGHVVAIAREAEQCAPNCEGMSEQMESILKSHISMPLPYTGDNEGARTRMVTQGINDNSGTALVAYAKTFLQGPLGETKAVEWYNISQRMFFVHQKEHRPDNVNGNFACRECGTEGQRDTVPAFYFRYNSWQIIIPIRDESDQMLVAAMRKGWFPRTQKKKDHAGPAGRFGCRGHRHGGRHEDGMNKQYRITKNRVEEKKKVISQLREDQILEMVADMKVFGATEETEEPEE